MQPCFQHLPNITCFQHVSKEPLKVQGQETTGAKIRSHRRSAALAVGSAAAWESASAEAAAESAAASSCRSAAAGGAVSSACSARSPCSIQGHRAQPSSDHAGPDTGMQIAAWFS